MKLIDLLFDPKYRSGLNQATRAVPLLRWLYLLAVPLAKLLHGLKLTPNSITHLSNLAAIAAVACLAWAANPWWFPLLWTAALLLDMADGIVARTHGLGSAMGSFYDHMSDQVKVILVFLAVGLRHDTQQMWILTYSTCTLFLFTNIVNQVQGMRALRLANAESNAAEETSAASTKLASAAASSSFRNWLRRVLAVRPRLKGFLLGVYASIFVMYGNAMMLLLPLSFSKAWAAGTLLFFCMVTLRSLLAIIKSVAGINGRLSAMNASWK